MWSYGSYWHSLKVQETLIIFLMLGQVLFFVGKEILRFGLGMTTRRKNWYKSLAKECSSLSQSAFSRSVVAFSSNYYFSLDGYAPKTRSSSGKATVPAPKPFRKVCARLSSGVRYGIGFTLERSCGPECIFCTGTAFERKCRYFSFRPHYEVKLELKNAPPALKVCVGWSR